VTVIFSGRTLPHGVNDILNRIWLPRDKAALDHYIVYGIPVTARQTWRKKMAKTEGFLKKTAACDHSGRLE